MECVTERAPVLLRRVSVLGMVALMLVTFGLYQPCWFLLRRAGLNRLDSPRKIDRWSFIAILVAIGVTLCLGIASAVAGSQATDENSLVGMIQRALELLAGITVLVHSFATDALDTVASTQVRAGFWIRAAASMIERRTRRVCTIMWRTHRSRCAPIPRR